jgi:hypothetical protein
MTWRKRTIMEMARDSHMDVYGLGKDRDKFVFVLEAFAELVRADEAERYKWDIHSCSPTCTKIGCVAVREAVKAEREACAKVCDNWPNGRDDVYLISVAIRARGQA